MNPSTTPLGPLLNFTVNRRITLRPVVSRVLEKETNNNNVVYVTAVSNQDEVTTTTP